MKISRFDEAVESFTEALNADPADQEVALNLARAMKLVHRYDETVAAYLHAIDLRPTDYRSRLEYAKVLLQLKRKEDAQFFAADALDTLRESSDWENQSFSAEFHALTDNLDMALAILEKLTAPGRLDIPADSAIELRRRAAELHAKLAEDAEASGNKKGAIDSYARALALNPGHPPILLALAQLHLSENEPDKCREYCQQVLRSDDKCEAAALMLAEVSSTDSVDDLTEVFKKSPSFHRTLVRLIEKCARVGMLDRVPAFLAQSQEAAGLSFCNGLYHFYKGNPQQALMFFTKGRSDPEWRQPSLQMIFEVYSNPNRKYVWCETKPLASPKDLESARKVLGRFDRSAGDFQRWHAQLLLATNTNESVTEALRVYSDEDVEDLSVVIGKCKCFLRLDRQREATRNLNQLIHGQQPNHFNFAEYVEAFLMMTFISLKEKQMDEAEKYVEKALDLNKSCGKAWELKGIIFERKKEFVGAADAFKQAWELSGHADLGIGFKLAMNFMKAEDPVEAIKVARAIMAVHPNYPKLKEVIFLPCCAALRP
jgi:tetratricopeptide repeat protein 21B